MGIPELIAVVIISMIFSVAATVYQRQRMKKLQQKAAEEADKQKGFQLVGEGSSDPINVFYGRNKVGGTRVYHRVLNWYSYAAPASGGQAFTSAGNVNYPMVTSANIFYIEANDGNNSYIRGNRDNTNTIVTLNNQPANVSATSITLNLGNLQPSDAAIFQNCASLTNNYRVTIRHYPLFNSPYGDNTTNMEVLSASYFIDDANSNYSNGIIVLKLDDYTKSLRNESLIATNVHSTDMKNEFLYVQQVIGYGGIQGIVSVDIDDKPYSEKAWWDRDTPGGSVRIHVYPEGGLDPMINASITAAKTNNPVDNRANDDKRDQAYFTNTAYASMVFRLHRNDPQFQGIPTVQFYLEGMKVAPILYNGGTYSLGTKTYSNNPALCLLDYLMNDKYGKGLSISQIDLPSFYHAMLICDRLVPLDESNNLSVTKVGKFWVEKGGTRQVKLYECNLGIDTSKPVRDNIEVLLETMGQAELVWSGGTYKLQLEYPMVYGSQHTSYMASGSHTILFGSGGFNIGDVVQYSSGSPSTPDLYRALQATGSNLPTVLGSYWAKDVVKAYLTDDDIIRDEQIGQSWPSLQNKHNYYTVKFLNESKDFAEDSVSWPSKDDPVYIAYKAEDNMPLEGETFQTGDTTEWHARATAEQIVRGSRNQVIFKFNVPIKYSFLEPGDFIKVTSTVLNIPGELLKVEEIKVNDKLQAEIQAIKFDAAALAWNAKDSEVVPNRDIYFNKYGTASNLNFVASTSGLIAGTLTWTPTNDPSVKAYSVKYTTELISRIWSGTTWETLPTTAGNSIDIPSLPDGKYVFTVVSVLDNGTLIPYINPQNGVQWPLLEATIVQTPIVAANYSVVVENTDVIQRNDDNKTFSPATLSIKGYKYTSALTAYSGYYTVETYNGSSWTTRYSATVAASSYAYTVVECQKVRVRMYSTYSNGVLSGLLDEEILSVINQNEFAIVVINDNATLSADSSGSVPSNNLSNANATVYVTKGITRQELTDVVGGELGKWNITVSRSLGLSGTFTIDTINKQYSSTISSFSNSYDVGTVTFTANSLDSVTGSSLPSLTDIQTLSKTKSGAAGAAGGDAILISLLYSADIISSENDGTGYTLPTGNYIRLHKAGVQLTNSDGVIFSGGGTQNGLTCSVNSTTGAITLSGNSWSTDREAFSLSASYNSKTYTISYTITKSKKGSDVIIADLLKESDIVATNNDGTGYTLPTGNALRLIKGGTILSSGVSYSGGTTKNGLTCSINNTTGSITLSGNSWTSDQESFTLTATYNSIAYSAIYSIVKSKTGATGSPGSPGSTGKKSATVNLYQWNVGQPNPPTTGSTILTWSGMTQTVNSSLDNNWVINPGTNTSPGINLYTCEKIISDTDAASSTLIDWTTNRSVYQVGMNGQNGIPGVAGTSGENYAQIKVYKWADTKAGAGTPTNTYTYTWGTSNPISKSGTPEDGWSTTVSASVAGQTCWEASTWVHAQVGTVSTSTTAQSSWSVTAVGYGGANGLNGTNGTSGSSSRTAYNKYTSVLALTGTVTVTGDNKPAQNSVDNADGTKRWATVWPVAWSDSPPTLADNEYLYIAEGSYNPNTSTTVWQSPYIAALKVGKLSAISANMGDITAGTMKIGTGATSFNVDINGNIWSGAANFAGAPFSVSNTGVLKATGATVAGTITASAINTGATVYMDNTGIWAGNATLGLAPVRIYPDGKFHFGNTTKYVDWNGSTFSVGGDIVDTPNLKNNAVTTMAVTDLTWFPTFSTAFSNPYPTVPGDQHVYSWIWETPTISISSSTTIVLQALVIIDPNVFNGIFSGTSSLYVQMGYKQGSTYTPLVTYDTLKVEVGSNQWIFAPFLANTTLSSDAKGYLWIRANDNVPYITVGEVQLMIIGYKK